jgi:hypothetical protein
MPPNGQRKTIRALDPAMPEKSTGFRSCKLMLAVGAFRWIASKFCGGSRCGWAKVEVSQSRRPLATRISRSV